jgi:hypothetical protein
MPFLRTTRLAATAAATAGLTLGGLSLAAPAEAATQSASATYTCASPIGAPPPLNLLLPSTFQVPATFTLQNLPEVLTANVPVPAGTPIVGQLDLTNANLAGLLPTVLTALQTTVNLVLGNVPGSEPIAGPVNTVFQQLNGQVATVSGQLGSFVPSADGLPLPIPTSFDFGTLAGGLAGLGIKCTYNPGSAKPGGGGGGGGTTPVIQKQGAKIKAHAKAKPGHKVLVTVKVKTSAGQKGVGQIKAKVAGLKAQTKTLKNGKVKFVLKGLRAGKNKIKLKFLGNSYTNKATKKVSVKVAR